MPDCSTCGTAASVSKQEGWWTCLNDECSIMAFYDPTAPVTEDPRLSQQPLSNFGGHDDA